MDNRSSPHDYDKCYALSLPMNDLHQFVKLVLVPKDIRFVVRHKPTQEFSASWTFLRAVLLTLATVPVVTAGIWSQESAQRRHLVAATDSAVSESEKAFAEDTRSVATLWAAVIAAIAAIVNAVLSTRNAQIVAAVPLAHAESVKRFYNIRRAKTDVAAARQLLEHGEILLSYVQHRDVAALLHGVLKWPDARSMVIQLMKETEIWLDDDLIERHIELLTKHKFRIPDEMISQLCESVERGEKFDLSKFEVTNAMVLSHIEDCFAIPKYMVSVEDILDEQLSRLAQRIRH
jgi:hypothetical protein